MTSQNQNIRLLPLSGVYDDGPYCYLLMIDECCILLDCGWDDRFNMEYIDKIMAHAPSIDAILISHSDRVHLGALPILVKKGLKCPIYATVPVANLGKLVMYDWMNSHHNIEEFDVFNLDDIDTAWKGVISVNYNQKIMLTGRNVVVKPFCSGHSLGGAVWRITKTGEEAIVYAVAFNHRKERHLNAMPFKDFYRAHVFIMDSVNALYNPPRRKLRDENLVKRIVETVRNGGDVMIVTDTAGRVLETAHFLDYIWNSPAMSNLRNYTLAMMSHVSASVVEHAKMHIDWMNDKIAKTFEETADNPFKFKHVHLVHRIQDLDRLRSPKVVMCSQVDMESGYSHELFPMFVADSRNTIILTGKGRKDTLGAKLLKMAEEGAKGNRFVFDVRKRIPLDGPELEEYRLRNKQRLEAEQEKRLEKFRREQRVHEGVSSSEESDDDEEMADAVDKYMMESDIRNRKRKRIEDDRAFVPAIPGISIKLLAESALLGKRKEASDDEGIEMETNQAKKAKSRRHLSEEERALHPYLDNQFDIFFRHHVLTYYGIANNDTKKKRRAANFPMFSFDNEKKKAYATDYGERINTEIFQERQRNDMFVPAPMQKPEMEGFVDEKAKRKRRLREDGLDEDDEDEEDDILFSLADEDWPTKCVSVRELVEIKCNIEFIDFEGRADGESLAHVLEQVRPRTLILVQGTEKDNNHLREFCEEHNVVEAGVYAPQIDETVSLGLNMQFVDIELTDELCEQIKFTPLLDGGKMAWIDARMISRKKLREKLLPEMREKFIDETNEDSLVADLCPRELSQPHDTVYMNDVKLMTIRDEVRRLVAEAKKASDKVSVELRQGRLVIGQSFAIKRIEAGKFLLEGTIGENYYKWRDFCVKKFAMA
ncbi:unnamed protein product, partial [Mesorhabditis belari]|uniref:Cleavage and polyadenylation specificity factor subunit 2 n=1 Tax=Mesorhabditis belari TaxID=2138241 RepID=A0AAF3EQS9_9BILA